MLSNGVAADRAFDCGDLDAGHQFLAVERLSPSVALHHQQVGGDMFIGGETLIAIVAASSAADAVAGDTGVDDSVRCVSAVRTSHDQILADTRLYVVLMT